MNGNPKIKITAMAPDELERIGELDRSEHVTRAYKVQHGSLTPVDVDWRIRGWSRDGDGPHSLSHQVTFCRALLKEGAVMLGAFQGELLVGTALLRHRLREDLAQLAFMYVSREQRRQGIAGRLVEEVCRIARETGAGRLYISSIPSASAVGFYLSLGCRLAEETIPELVALEPEDIHLILDL